jgi:hypothetical protein
MTTRDTLIQQLDAAYEDYRSAIDGLGEHEFEKKWLDNAWGAREITAHITGWLGQLGAGLERMSRGERPQPEGEMSWTDEGDAWNAKFAEHAKGKKHDQVLHELESGMDSFKKAAMLVPEDRYGEGKTTNRIFDGAGIVHFKEHADMIREWRSREGV